MSMSRLPSVVSARRLPYGRQLVSTLQPFRLPLSARIGLRPRLSACFGPPVRRPSLSVFCRSGRGPAHCAQLRRAVSSPDPPALTDKPAEAEPIGGVLTSEGLAIARPDAC